MEWMSMPMLVQSAFESFEGGCSNNTVGQLDPRIHNQITESSARRFSLEPFLLL